MKYRILSLILTIIYIFSCQRKESAKVQQLWMQEENKLKVLCTTAMVGDLVQRVGGDAVACHILIQGQHDPHSYQLVKGDDEKFIHADVIFYNGLGLEHGPSLAHNLEKNPKAYGVGNELLRTMPDQILDLDGVVDPHIWMDVSLFSETLSFIAKVLAEKMPQQKETFFANQKLHEERLKQLHHSIQLLLLQLPEEKRYLVTTHDAFNYFARAYLAEEQERHDGFWKRCQAPEGLAPDSQMSTQDISRLLEHLVRYNIHCLFAESNISQDSIRKLLDASKQIGHDVRISSGVLYADAMGKAGTDGDSYEKMILHNANLIRKELEK